MLQPEIPCPRQEHSRRTGGRVMASASTLLVNRTRISVCDVANFSAAPDIWREPNVLCRRIAGGTLTGLGLK
jgi:hypothetical protein